MSEINRRKLGRLPKEKRVRVLILGGHNMGLLALMSFFMPWNWCWRNCEVVGVVPDRNDTPSARFSIWSMSRKRTFRLRLVPNFAKRHKVPIFNLPLYPGVRFNQRLIEVIRQTRPDVILISTFRGIIRQDVLDLMRGTNGLVRSAAKKRVQPRVFNIHPSGIARDQHGNARIRWPERLFEGKRTVFEMINMGKRFRRGESRWNCEEAELVVHRVLPPPGIDRGPLICASRYPIILPQEGERDLRKRFNSLQVHLAAHCAQLLHENGPLIFTGARAPYFDPRAHLRRKAR
jgi:folate-dependent phosphoribosylglycinamide formyltransferase PurN